MTRPRRLTSIYVLARSIHNARLKLSVDMQIDDRHPMFVFCVNHGALYGRQRGSLCWDLLHLGGEPNMRQITLELDMLRVAREREFKMVSDDDVRAMWEMQKDWRP